jgi:YegS/Rv2252/BmrU family lipid kinase
VPKEKLFIINPLSGGKDKRIVEALIRGRCPESRVVFTERPGHGEALARECPEQIVVAVGGDGTVSEVARGVIGTEKTLGIIPQGSGDGLALHLGISRLPLVALEEIIHGHTEKVDYATVNGRPFFCTAGVGLDAEVAWKFASDKKRGLARYIHISWDLWKGYKPDTYTIIVDGVEHRLPAVIVTVGNANQWGNEARITDRASICDGMLDVAVVQPFKSLEIPQLAAKLMAGRTHTSKRVTYFRGREVVIRRSAPGPAHFDGDPLWLEEELHLEVVPAAFNVIVPFKHKI